MDLVTNGKLRNINYPLLMTYDTFVSPDYSTEYSPLNLRYYNQFAYM